MTREVEVIRLVSGVIAVSVVAVFAFMVSAAAQTKQMKKLTYDEAWATCKAEIAKNVSPNEGRDSAARYAAGGACMKKYGYRLKKGAM